MNDSQSVSRTTLRVPELNCNFAYISLTWNPHSDAYTQQMRRDREINVSKNGTDGFNGGFAPRKRDIGFGTWPWARVAVAGGIPLTAVTTCRHNVVCKISGRASTSSVPRTDLTSLDPGIANPPRPPAVSPAPDQKRNLIPQKNATPAPHPPRRGDGAPCHPDPHTAPLRQVSPVPSPHPPTHASTSF